MRVPNYVNHSPPDARLSRHRPLLIGPVTALFILCRQSAGTAGALASVLLLESAYIHVRLTPIREGLSIIEVTFNAADFSVPKQ